MKLFQKFSALLFIVVLTSALAQAYNVDGKNVDDFKLCQTIEKKFFDAVNAHRLKLGLAPVVYNWEIALSCKQHVINLTRFDIMELVTDRTLSHRVAHENYDARWKNYREILKANGLVPKNGGEIAFLGPSMVFDQNHNLLIDATVQHLLDGFLASPGHKAIIETPYHAGSYFGAGATMVNGRIIFASNFAGIQ